MPTFRTSLLTSLKAIILALLLSVGISYLYAAWANPTDTPPNGNTPAPINVGLEPLVFQRASFSLALSLLTSAFALLIPPAYF